MGYFGDWSFLAWWTLFYRTLLHTIIHQEIRCFLNLLLDALLNALNATHRHLLLLHTEWTLHSWVTVKLGLGPFHLLERSFGAQETARISQRHAGLHGLYRLVLKLWNGLRLQNWLESPIDRSLLWLLLLLGTVSGGRCTRYTSPHYLSNDVLESQLSLLCLLVTLVNDSFIIFIIILLLSILNQD